MNTRFARLRKAWLANRWVRMGTLRNAMILPLVFYYLIRLAGNRTLMGQHANSAFQRNFTSGASVVIALASVVTVVALFIK